MSVTHETTDAGLSSASIHRIFGKNYPGRGPSEQLSLVEIEHPAKVDALRNFLKSVCTDYTPDVFDYHKSWPFARATTGWLFDRDPLSYLMATRMAVDLMSAYPEVHVLTEDYSGIYFQTRSAYIDTPKLNQKFAKDCAFTKVFTEDFPEADFRALSAWLSVNKDYLDELHGNDYQRRAWPKFKGHYSIMDVNHDRLDAWSKEIGRTSWVVCGLTSTRAEAKEFQARLNESGFTTHLERPYQGFHDLHITRSEPITPFS